MLALAIADVSKLLEETGFGRISLIFLEDESEEVEFEPAFIREAADTVVIVVAALLVVMGGVTVAAGI
jgi:hypothetical protein